MADPTFATKDPATVEAEVLARYKAATGVSLAPGDPRRLHLQALMYELALLRIGINFAGRQNLLRFVSDEFIDDLGALWKQPRLPALPSQCTQRFHTTALPGVVYTVLAGRRVTDGNGNTWAVVATHVSGAGDSTIDALVRCTVAGGGTNGITAGQIDTLVDPIPGILSTENISTTISGRDLESTEAYRARLQGEPERYAVAGPRGAYEALARAASASVEDAVALGPDDATDLDGAAPDPGNVVVLIMEAGEDEPSSGLMTTVQDYLSAEERRPLGDRVSVIAPSFVNYSVSVIYYVARSRAASLTEIQAAITAAGEDFKKWQRKIGRDVNPSELIARLVAAGAKRVAVTSPAFASVKRDQCSKLITFSIGYGGIEND